MRINEYIKQTGLTYKQIFLRIQKGTIKAVKKGKEWDILIGGEKAAGEDLEKNKKADSATEKLKEEFLSLKIRKLEQELRERQKYIEEKFKTDLMDKIIETLKPLPEAYRKCKLTKQQTLIIQNALKESLNALKHV